MEIAQQNLDNVIVIKVIGRIDTLTAPELAQAVYEIPSSAKKLIFDFEQLEYISSAGLRVVLTAHKKMDSLDGELIVRNSNEMVKSIFTLTGFSGILTLED